jgi:hypothetical protein
MAGCVRQRPPKPLDELEEVDSKELYDEEAAMTAASAATVFSIENASLSVALTSSSLQHA